MSLPYFPMYPTDFEADTSHLTLAEDGAYNRLLRLMWMTAGCSLPDDNAWVKRRMRVDQDTFDSIVLVVIEEFFQRKSGRIISPRLAKEYQKTDLAHKKRVAAGSKGGKAKALQTNKNKSSNAKAMLKQPEPEPEPYKEDTNVSLAEVPKAIEMFKEVAKENGWPIPRILNAQRKASLKARLKECDGIEGWQEALIKAANSKHCNGENDRGWVISFDFMVTQSSFAKLMEGNYDNRTNGGHNGKRTNNGQSSGDAQLNEAVERAIRIGSLPDTQAEDIF